MNRKMLLFLCLISLILVMFSLDTSVQAQGPNKFVSPEGGGTTCSQAEPCSPNVGITEANSGDKVYFRYGNYTNVTLTIDKSISLYGGWDGEPTGPFYVDPQLYPSTLNGEKSRNLMLIDDASNLMPVVISGFTFSRGSSITCAAIDIQNGLAVIEGNQFLKNIANSRGGAICVESAADVVIRNNVFEENAAFLGGAIYIDIPDLDYPRITIDDNQFTDNGAGASFGGGIYIQESSVVNIVNNDFISNTADNGGGAIYFSISEHHTPELLIESNYFTENKIKQGFSGAAIRIESQSARINRNLFLSNDTPETAVIDIGSGDTLGSIITNNMIINSNTGIQMIGKPVGTHIIVHNTIVSATENGIKIELTDESVPVNVTNNIITHTAVSIFGKGENFTGSNNLFFNNSDDPNLLSEYILEQDPLFVDRGNHDYHLMKGSPAIDAGAVVGFTEDFDGDQRPSGAGFDIGADELVSKQFLFLPLIRR